MADPQFAQQRIIVTGGSGGLGRAIVGAFLAAGARVVIADLEPPLVMPNCSGAGEVLYLPLEVASEPSWINLMDAVDVRWGGLDVLVNNAGFFRPNIRFEEMPLDLWRKHMAINADGVFLGCKHAILRMKTQGWGSIVNIGSSMSITASATGAAYCAAKAAVLMTTKTAAASAGDYGVRVNAVLPGAVRTSMLMGNIMDGEDQDAFLAKLRTKSALDRLATPEDVARAVLFLADPANASISGVALPVDGGTMPGA